MWEERIPNPGETVKIEFAKWTGLETQIGIFLRRHDGRAIINLGRRLIYLSGDASFLVWNPKIYLVEKDAIRKRKIRITKFSLRIFVD